MSEPSESTTDFKYIPEMDLLFQKATSPSQDGEPTCEVINVQPFQSKNNKLDMREMRSRQHLQYEQLQKFNDSNEFDRWWTVDGNSKGWIFNTIYKKKTEDEVHVYRCGHKRCSCRVRVVFIANSCDVIVEHALIDHNHNDAKQSYKPDSIRTLSSEIKSKISVFENLGMTATKIRRTLFKELQSSGAPLPTLKQIQNYIGRLRIKRPNLEISNLPQTPSTSLDSTDNIPRNLDGTPRRKRGRPRLSEQRNDVPIQLPIFKLEQPKPEPVNRPEKIEQEPELAEQQEEQAERDDQPNELTTMTEEEILQKLNEFLQASQTPATLAKTMLEQAPPMKRVRLSYHFEKNFPSTETFHNWWSGPRSQHMIHNSTYLNNAGEKIDIYRCSKRECRHRVRVVSNPTDNTVCVERTDMDHDIAVHEAKSTLTKQAKDTIVELNSLGLKPKAILTHFLQNKSIDPTEVPTMTQIKNLVNRLKIKQKESAPPTMTSSNEFTWNLESATSSLIES